MFVLPHATPKPKQICWRTTETERSDECKSRIAEVTAIAMAKAQRTLRLLNNVQHIKTAFKALQYSSEWAYNLFGSFLSSKHRALMGFVLSSGSMRFYKTSVSAPFNGTKHREDIVEFYVFAPFFFSSKNAHIKILIKAAYFFLFVVLLLSFWVFSQLLFFNTLISNRFTSNIGMNDLQYTLLVRWQKRTKFSWRIFHHKMYGLSLSRKRKNIYFGGVY